MKRATTLLLALALAITACQPVETEPAVSTEADEEAIKALVQEFTATINSDNLDGFMALWTDDAVLMPPTSLAVIGKEAIRSRVERIFAMYTIEIRCAVEDIQVAGDWAYVRNSCEEADTPKDGSETRSLEESIVFIFQRQADGSWKIATEI